MLYPLSPMNRRLFLRNSALATASLGLAGLPLPASSPMPVTKNKLPRWRGFNLLDYFSPRPGRNPSARTTDDDFRWMRDWGFDFVRLPVAYPRYVTFDRTRDITPEEVYNIDEKIADDIEALITRAHRHGLHVSFSLHRAPGYCINAGFREPYNLWKDEAARQAFYHHWTYWGKRFRAFSPQKISFDLLNEPAMREDMNDQHSKIGPVPGPLYRELAENALRAIRQSNPDHLVIANGNNVGNNVVNEITDLPIAQSCRGYYPSFISHHQATWVFKDPSTAPKPVWPGREGDKLHDRQSLERYYKPWTDLVAKGVGVHCGECGCWSRTPHPVFLAWFGDVLDVLTQHQIGYGIWNFRGDFGILDSNRTDVAYEDWHGHKLDRRFLELLQAH